MNVETCGRKGDIGGELEICGAPAVGCVPGSETYSGDPEGVCEECGWWIHHYGILKPLKVNEAVLATIGWSEAERREAWGS